MFQDWLTSGSEVERSYVSEVLSVECLVKFYADIFGFDRTEAEKRMWETPLDESDESQFL